MHGFTTDQATGEIARFLAIVNGKPPIWANLGQIVTEAKTAQEALKLAHLDFTLANAPIYTQWKRSGLLAVPDHKAIVRLDTHETVGVVGKDFDVMQPTEAFDFTNTLAETNEANYISAGLLHNGSQMWILMEVPAANISVFEDKHNSYLLFSVGFDGSMARTTKLTTVRVECANTLAMALGGAGTMFRVKNTKNSDKRMEAAKRMLSGVTQDAAQLQTKLEKLARRTLTKQTFVDILDTLFPKNEQAEKQTRRDNILTTVAEIYESNDNNAFPEQRGTAYNLLNAIINYADHERSTRKGADGSEDVKRSESALFGSGSVLKDQAFDVIYRMTDGTEQTRTVFKSVEVPLLDAIIDEADLPL